MNGKTLLEAIGYADEKYVSRTFSKFYVSKTGEKASGIWNAVKIAAGVAAVLAVILAIWIPSILFHGPYTPGTTDTGTAPAKTELTSASDTDGITTAEPVVTEPPTTEPDETEPPTTEAPATEPPTTEAPATEPPTTEAPVTEPPTTEAPETEPPATEPPTTEAPETEPPVTEPPVTLVSTIKINASQTSLVVGETMKLTATVKPDNADNKAVKWSISSGSSYAKISSDGTLTAVKAGQCTVKATAEDASGVSATVKITITEPEVLTFEEAVAYPVDGPAHSFSEGDLEEMFSIFPMYERGRSVTPGEAFQIWFAVYEDMSKIYLSDVDFKIVSGSEYATLDKNGIFTAKAEGEVKIRATLKANGVSCDATITIKTQPKLDKWEGSGTFRDPYLINTVEDFERIKTVCDSNTSGYWFLQTADLDFSGIEWTPPTDFRHKYDGGGHKIINMTVAENAQYPGVFGRAINALIKNLTVENYTYVSSRQNSGGAGVIFGFGEGCAVYDCHVKTAVVEAGETVGGFAGFVQGSCTFVNCSTDAACKAIYCVGGFVGFYSSTGGMYGVFYNCSATGTATATGGEDILFGRCGGFFGNQQTEAGYMNKRLFIVNCSCSQTDEIIAASKP